MMDPPVDSPSSTTATTSFFVVVIGLHRQRLAKIMNLVYETTRNKGDCDETNETDLSKTIDTPHVTYVPCIAKMGSYEAEDGTEKRYLADLLYSSDGTNDITLSSSSTIPQKMSDFLDDDEFRSTLRAVIMVGYDWQQPELDNEQITNFFQTMRIDVPLVTCVQPNDGFSHLMEEMNYFKGLSDEEKLMHQSQRTMGPGKMAGFILRTAQPITESFQAKKHDGNSSSEIVDGNTKYSSNEESLSNENGDTTQSTEQAVDANAQEQPDIEPSALIPNFNDSDIDPNATKFACRICRTVLFSENYLTADHIPNLHSFRKRLHGGHTTTSNNNNNNSNTSKLCTSIFCDESVLEWLGEHGSTVEGKLKCSKCTVKLGHWNWSGAQCSCGTWVTPAIQIPVSKVDIIEPICNQPSCQPVMNFPPSITSTELE